MKLNLSVGRGKGTPNSVVEKRLHAHKKYAGQSTQVPLKDPEQPVRVPAQLARLATVRAGGRDVLYSQVAPSNVLALHHAPP